MRKASAKRAHPLPTTLGEHILSVRSERKLLQKDVAAEIGVTPETIGHWEANKTEPPIHVMPAIIRFLGYDPIPEPTTLAERMRAYRQRNGLSIKKAATQAGVDESSWGLWERTGHGPWVRYRTLLDDFLTNEGVRATE